MKKRTIFVTGATGYLGCHLVYELLRQGHRVFALVRDSGKGGADSVAQARVEAAVAQVNPDEAVDFSRLVAVKGNVVETAVSLIEKVRCKTAVAFDEVWHCVATFKFKESELDEIKAINIGGVENMVNFVLGLNSTTDQPPPRYFHVSTAYSSGRNHTVIPEAITRNNKDYRTLYEWSKHQGESLVQRYQQEYQLDAMILRPAIIIGSEKTRVFNHSAYYQVISALYRLCKQLATRQGSNFDGNVNMRLIGDPTAALNFVPVDYVVETMLHLGTHPDLATDKLKIFNIVNEAPPTVGLVHNIFCQCLNITGLDLVPQSVFDDKPMNRLERALARNVAFQMPYMHEEIRFSTKALRQVLPHHDFPNPTIDEAFLRTINQAFFDQLEERLSKNGRSAS
ncbi:MAG: SDR family oxidoreductase [Chloroflexota bacterium]